VRLVFSNFKDDERAQLSAKAKALGAEMFDQFDESITHVVCWTWEEQFFLCFISFGSMSFVIRVCIFSCSLVPVWLTVQVTKEYTGSLKVLSAVILGQWIVGSTWINRSATV
jgi:hypothetical protein